jgi:hypothetical protein
MSLDSKVLTLGGGKPGLARPFNGITTFTVEAVPTDTVYVLDSIATLAAAKEVFTNRKTKDGCDYRSRLREAWVL